MNLRLRTLALLALLSLLQGIAPLLHAHVGGQFARTGAHLHLATALPGSAVATGVAERFAGDQADSYQASESAEVGLGLVIERRLLIAAAPDASLPAFSLWRLLADAGCPEAWQPITSVPGLSPGRNISRTPPSNGPPAIPS